MNRRTGAVVLALMTLLMMLITAAARAQAPPSPGGETGDRLGWHVVRPGETLESITEHFLGTHRLWRENWKLNPQIDNPNLLSIGQRLRIITSRTLPPRAAEVNAVTRRVELKPDPNPWMKASVGDLLKERDGMRTYERSSTEIRLDDGTTVALTENTLVFLREIRRELTGVDREQIEVVAGQADLEAWPKRADSSDIEIIIGGTLARPRPGAEGTARSRLRRPEAGGAQVMVYGGRTAVEAAGEAVEVPAGMGTAVPEDGPPRPPERLLPRPRLRSPAAGQRLAFTDPILAWHAVDAARSYTVEVCSDRGCASQVARVTGVAATSWRPRDLPQGELFWRVTAVAASGLDGFPARGRALVIAGDRADAGPPVVAVIPGNGAVALAADRVRARSGASLTLAVHDDASGVATVEWRWSEGAWRRWRGGNLKVPTAAGTHRLEIRATDRAGHSGSAPEIEVTVVGEAPLEPAVSARDGGRRAGP